MTVEGSDANFANEVLAAEGLILVDFWADWCGPCKGLSQILNDLSQEMQGRVKFVELNAGEHHVTTTQYNVRSMPTLLLFKGGEVIDMKVGAATPKVGLIKWLESHAA